MEHLLCARCTAWGTGILGMEYNGEADRQCSPLPELTFQWLKQAVNKYLPIKEGPPFRAMPGC